MVFESTYLMIIYFNYKKKQKSVKKIISSDSVNSNATTVIS